MSARVAIAGAGAVSPAGWSAAGLASAVFGNRDLPPEVRESGGSCAGVRVRCVPPAEKNQIRHPRLRRASPVVRFAVAAAMEALGAERREAVRAGDLRLGIVVNVVNGCVGYSRRFYEEVLADVATASPILFPETVFNATASHVAAVLETTAVNYTLLGDPTQFLSGVDIAAGWLVRGLVDGCLVIGAEELDWLSFEAARVFSRTLIASEGAGAIYLETSAEPEIELVQVTPAVSYGSGCAPVEAAARMRGALPPVLPDARVFSDARGAGGGEGDAGMEELAVRDTLGFGFAAATAWQAVLAREALVAGRCRHALVLGIGTDQQAIGAHLRKN